jgi:hypothetical protein
VTSTRYRIRYYGVGTGPKSSNGTNLIAGTSVSMVATARRISSVESVRGN